MVPECSKIEVQGIPESLSIIRGQELEYYESPRRVDYDINVTGPDFVVGGQGKFAYVTHVEVKARISSAIEVTQSRDGNLLRQGKKIGKTAQWQTKFWSNKTKTDKIPGITSDARLPESSSNMLVAVDLRDVPNGKNFK